MPAAQRLALAAAYGVDPLNPEGPAAKPGKKQKKATPADDAPERDPKTGDLFASATPA